MFNKRKRLFERGPQPSTLTNEEISVEVADQIDVLINQALNRPLKMQEKFDCAIDGGAIETYKNVWRLEERLKFPLKGINIAGIDHSQVRISEEGIEKELMVISEGLYYLECLVRYIDNESTEVIINYEPKKSSRIKHQAYILHFEFLVTYPKDEMKVMMTDFAAIQKDSKEDVTIRNIME